MYVMYALDICALEACLASVFVAPGTALSVHVLSTSCETAPTIRGTAVDMIQWYSITSRKNCLCMRIRGNPFPLAHPSTGFLVVIGLTLRVRGG